MNDERGQLLHPNIAYVYTWRIAPYIGPYDFAGLIQNREIRENYQARLDLPQLPGRKSRQFSLSANPTFGINGTYIGGDYYADKRPELRSKFITRDDQVLFPSRLLVFASARGFSADWWIDENSFDGNGEQMIVPGTFRIVAPRAGATRAYYDDPAVRWDPTKFSTDFGKLDLRHANKAVCMQFDGHGEMLGLKLGSREGLRDMRRWANDATTDDWMGQ